MRPRHHHGDACANELCTSTSWTKLHVVRVTPTASSDQRARAPSTVDARLFTRKILARVGTG
jgi:hypothetical protein